MRNLKKKNRKNEKETRNLRGGITEARGDELLLAGGWRPAILDGRINSLDQQAR